MRKNNVMKVWFSLFILFAFASCGVQSYVEKDPNVDLKKYRTYAWINEDNPKGKENKPYKDFQETYLKDLISKELEKNGFQKAKSHPDVLVDYDIMIENQVRERSQSVYSRPFVRYFYNPYTGRINSMWLPSRYMGENSYDVPYKSGTITINLVDNDSQKLVWQGWAETEVTNRHIDKDDMNKIVKSIFKKLDVATR
jgi:hypothetical protein